MSTLVFLWFSSSVCLWLFLFVSVCQRRPLYGLLTLHQALLHTGKKGMFFALSVNWLFHVAKSNVETECSRVEERLPAGNL